MASLGTLSVSSDCFHDPKSDSECESESSSEENISMDPEEVHNNLLLLARNGYADKVQDLLAYCDREKIPCHINFKGRSKCNMGWTAVHLAAYFGHNDVVRVLLQNGADMNTQNDCGDTALHKAAYTGREETVTLLLSQDANVTIRNAEGLQAKHLARSQNIRRLIEAAENYDSKKEEEEFLRAARENDLETLTLMLQQRKPACISCTDCYGNSALHNATYRGHKEVIILLVQNGIDTTLRNGKGQSAEDMTSDSQMKKLVSLQPIKTQDRQIHRVEGPLLRKAGVLGWRPVWIVLEKGVISIFRKRADACTGVKRKTFRYLNDAQVKAPKDRNYLLDLCFVDGSSWQLSVAMDTSVHINRQKWVAALTDHITYSKTWSLEGAHVSDDEENDEDLLPLGSIKDTLQTAQAHQQLVECQVASVSSGIDAFIGSSNNDYTPNPEVHLAKVNTELHHLVDTTRHMIKSMTHAMTILEQQDKVRQVQLDQEREKSRVLQDALRVLAEEHHSLELSIKSPRTSSMADSGDDQFYDCFEASFTENGTDCDTVSNGISSPELSVWASRCQLPAPMLSRNDISVWSILKQCIGKELSKITMPVIFNEPLSFLQRLVEYLEYADILKKATESHDPVKRLEYVTAFAVSATASNWQRLGKPFNPLLGETYQLIREDLGYKIVCEQVSHHPPVSAFHIDSPDYSLHGAVHPKLKFWGKSIEVTPKGILTLTLHRHKEVYTWQNVNCCIHNIIVGKIWVEHYGSMELNCITTQLKAVLHFKPSGWFSKELHKVEGHIMDSSKQKIKAFYGKWVEALYSCNMDVWEIYGQSVKAAKTDAVSHEQPTPSDHHGDVAPPAQVKDSSIDLQLEGQEMLWKATPKPYNSSKYYSFTHFAMMLNEMMESDKEVLPPTDCRRRPDIRKMEQGDLDGASSQKHRLEEKQRATRKERKKEKQDWIPRWFKRDMNPDTGREDWIYKGEYWQQDWSHCPRIF